MGVSVRHNAKLAAGLALVAAALGVAWFARALQTGSPADWAWTVVVATVSVVQLVVVRDGRAPLMVADEQGVRVRRGVTWSGLRWQDIEDVEVTSPRSWLRDGRIVVHPRLVDVLEEPAEDDESGESPGTETFSVPLGLTTRLDVEGLTGDLVADLDALASGRVPVLVVTRLEPEKAERPEKPAKPEKPTRAEKAALKALAADEAARVAEEARLAEPEPEPEPELELELEP
jgi:hypothetical protein